MASDTRTDLLRSAESTVRRRGFDAFSYADLAADVGIRKASIHYHFSTKADLSLALMQHYTERLAKDCDAIDGLHPQASDRLGAFIDIYEQALGDGNRVCLCVALSVSRDSLAGEVVDQIGAFRRLVLDWLTSVFVLAKTDGSIRQTGDPGSEAAATLALLEGAQLAARAAARVTPFLDATRALRLRLSQEPPQSRPGTGT